MKFPVGRLKGTEVSHLSLFMVIVVFVVFMVLVQKKELLLHSRVLDKNTLNLLVAQTRESGLLFVCVLRERCWVIPLLFLVSTTYLSRIMGYILVMWYGIGIGAIVGVALVRYGMLGILLVLAAGFPQFLLYVPAFVAAIKMNQNQRSTNNKFYMQLFILETMILIGCGMESYVNPIFLEKIIKLVFLG